jgi:hypothetical protein
MTLVVSATECLLRLRSRQRRYIIKRSRRQYKFILGSSGRLDASRDGAGNDNVRLTGTASVLISCPFVAF